MIEIPENRTISRQAESILPGRKIVKVLNATGKHKFAFFNGDPATYPGVLTGKKIISSRGHGMFVDLCLEDDMFLTISDGTIMRYYGPGEAYPEKYQLLILLDDGSFLVFTVAMYGGIWAFRKEMTTEAWKKYYEGSLNSISPLDDRFNEGLFESIIGNTTKDLSAKALLATEQRIPGLGNGVLQDILFNAGIHPKRKKSTLKDFELGELFHSLKVTLNKMTDSGGRDTEKDFFGKNGGYKTILSKNTLNDPCPNCGGPIKKEAYMGGAIYYCPVCQKN